MRRLFMIAATLLSLSTFAQEKKKNVDVRKAEQHQQSSTERLKKELQQKQLTAPPQMLNTDYKEANNNHQNCKKSKVKNKATKRQNNKTRS